MIQTELNLHLRESRSLCASLSPFMVRHSTFHLSFCSAAILAKLAKTTPIHRVSWTLTSGLTSDAQASYPLGDKWSQDATLVIGSRHTWHTPLRLSHLRYSISGQQ